MNDSLSQETEQQIQRYTRRAAHYDLEVRMLDLLLGSGLRRRLFAGSYEHLLEVGVGTGLNLPHYAAAARAVGIDLTPAMLEQARLRAKSCEKQPELLQMDVCALAFPDASFDRIVASCVFCSVPDPEAGFRELVRVLKPGGQVRLLEHMRPELPVLDKLFDWLDAPLYRHMGFHIARRTLDTIRSAGLQIDADETKLFTVFHYLELSKP